MSVPNDLRKQGFTTAETTITPRLIMAISGLEKQGKTHFSLTAPDPIAFFNLDYGTEGVVHKHADKTIYIHTTKMPSIGTGKTDAIQAEAKKAWAAFHKGFIVALESKTIRTIVIDTGTAIWELLRLARLGKLTQVKPHHYGPVNAEYEALFSLASDSDKNLIVLHKMKKEYVKDKWNGDYERAGYSKTGFLVQVNTVVTRDLPDRDGTPGEFNIEIVDCRQNPDLQGEMYSGDLCNFPWVATMVIEGTTPDDWE